MNDNQEVFSFDVFDTCLSRTYEKPSDLFFHLGLIIAPESADKDSATLFADRFVVARIDAERRSNKIHGKKRSCHITEIYSQLILSPQCTHSKSQIMQMELALEDRCLYAIESTKKSILQLRKKKKRIIFISDMYLDKSFIKTQLIKHGFFEDGDGLYVSSESTYIKRTGMLFKYALKNEGIEANQVLHTGDNLSCDIFPATKLGIKAKHFRDSEIMLHELAIPEKNFTPIDRRLNSIPKNIRLTNKIYTESELKLFSIVAPAIISFTLWVLQKAISMGLNRVYFVSRNGELPYKVAKLFTSQFPQIEAKFLYGSRKAWLLPSLSTQDPNWSDLIPRNTSSSIKDTLEKLSLENHEIKKIELIARKHNLSIQDIKSAKIIQDNFIFLLKEKSIKEIVFSKINSAKELALAYFQQEGLLKDDKWAIIDSGWMLNSQSYLNKIIKEASAETEAKGFYFGMTPNHLPTTIAGHAESFTRKLSIFSQRGYVVENCFLFSSLQSTSGYIKENHQIRPELTKLSHNIFETNYSEKIYAYISEYIYLAKKIEVDTFLFIKNKDVFIDNIKKLISNPDYKIASYLTNLRINEDIRHSDNNSHPLCKELTTKDLINQTMGFFDKRIKRQQVWIEASICLSRPIIGFLFRVLIELNKARYLILNFRRTYKNDRQQ